jgi:rubrerythrin
MRPLVSPNELYAHAIAIEREAAERYAEFAQRMSDLGNEAAAEVFATLARLEAEHLETLLARTRGVVVPEHSRADYAWLDAGAPETAARELVYRLMTPRRALAIALQAERRAHAFFEQVLTSAADPALRSLAREMAMDEQDHITLLERLLGRTPEAGPSSLVIFER